MAEAERAAEPLEALAARWQPVRVRMRMLVQPQEQARKQETREQEPRAPLEPKQVG